MKKTIEISLDKARELYKNGSEEIKTLISENFTEEELKDRVTKWEDLGKIEGYYVDLDSAVRREPSAYVNEDHRNIWATKEQAEACLAKSQLSQLMKHVNGDWKPDWMENSEKYVIFFIDEIPHSNTSLNSRKFLAFKEWATAAQFLKDHRELIEQAKPLL